MIYTHMLAGATILLGFLSVILLCWWFCIKRNRSTIELKILGEEAYRFAGHAMNLWAEGEPPTIELRKQPWKIAGCTVREYYSHYSLWGIMFYEKLEVVDDSDKLFPKLAYQMVRVIRTRRGEPLVEGEAKRIEEKAKAMALKCSYGV